jgi:hypothetical protein
MLGAKEQLGAFVGITRDIQDPTPRRTIFQYQDGDQDGSGSQCRGNPQNNLFAIGECRHVHVQSTQNTSVRFVVAGKPL